MYPIQRQADLYGIFEPQDKPERTAAAPESEVADLLRGPSIMAGLNVRHKEAVDTSGMDPREHAYGRQDYNPLFGEFGHEGHDYEGVSRGEFDHRMRGRDPRAEEEEARQYEDDESGYNWGPAPHPEDLAGPGMDPNFSDGAPLPFDTPTYNPGGNYDDHL